MLLQFQNLAQLPLMLGEIVYKTLRLRTYTYFLIHFRHSYLHSKPALQKLICTLSLYFQPGTHTLEFFKMPSFTSIVAIMAALSVTSASPITARDICGIAPTGTAAQTPLAEPSDISKCTAPILYSRSNKSFYRIRCPLHGPMRRQVWLRVYPLRPCRQCLYLRALLCPSLIYPSCYWPRCL